MPAAISQPHVIQSATGINGNQNPLPFIVTSVPDGTHANGMVVQDAQNNDGTGTLLYFAGVNWFSTSAAAVAYIAANYIDGGPDILVCYAQGT